MCFCSCIDSHHHTLMKLVVSLFFKLRLHHIAKMSMLSLQKDMRQKLSKTVPFIKDFWTTLQPDSCLKIEVYFK